MLTAKVASLTEDLNTKDNTIDELVKRVNTLEEAADAVEQYSRRPNLRFHGADGEGTDAKVVHIVNDVMKLQPPMLVDHLDRSHRLGHELKRMVGRDSARSSLVSAANAYEMLFSRRASPSKLTMLSIADRIFINEDLTGRRAMLARSTLTLKKDNKIVDCWMTVAY